MTQPSTPQDGDRVAPVTDQELTAFLHGELTDDLRLAELDERFGAEPELAMRLDELAATDRILRELFLTDDASLRLPEPYRSRIRAILAKAHRRIERDPPRRNWWLPLLVGGLAACLILAWIVPTVGYVQESAMRYEVKGEAFNESWADPFSSTDGEDFDDARPFGETSAPARSSERTKQLTTEIPQEVLEGTPMPIILERRSEVAAPVISPPPPPPMAASGRYQYQSDEARSRAVMDSPREEFDSRFRGEGSASPVGGTAGTGALESSGIGADEAGLAVQTGQLSMASSVSKRGLNAAATAGEDKSKRRDWAESERLDAFGDVPLAGRLFSAPAEPEPVVDSFSIVREEAPVFKDENPFDPISTFALNVSDRSLRESWNVLQQGRLPDPDSVMPEEFLNALSYADPAPTAEERVGVNWELSEDPFRPGQSLLRLNVQTAGTGNRESGGLDLVILADNSGSMQRADRREVFNGFLNALLPQLSANDKVRLQTLDGNAVVDLRPVEEPTGEVAAIEQYLDQQRVADPSLNPGLVDAARYLALNATGPSRRIVLLTDGAGVPAPDETEGLREILLANERQGVVLDAVLVAPESRDGGVLADILRETDGTVQSVVAPGPVADEVARALVGRFQPSARNAKVQVEFNSLRVAGYELIGYEKDRLAAEDFRNDAVDGGELAAAEQGNALYSLRLREGGSGPVAEVRVRFEDVATGIVREKAWEIPFTGTPPAIATASPSMQLAAASTHLALRLDRSLSAAEAPFDKLAVLVENSRPSLGSDPDFARVEEVLNQSRILLGE